jgi:ABC-type uncharacterized transport system substrate-binding protein
MPDASIAPDRRTVLLGSLAAVLTPRMAQAQPVKTARIGVLGSATSDTFERNLKVFRKGLHDLGWVEGQNLTVESRFLRERYDELPALAAGLVTLKVDVIFAMATPAIQAAKRATTTLLVVDVGNTAALAPAFDRIVRERSEALVLAADPILFSQRELIVELAARHRLPAVYEYRFFAELGGLLSYGPDSAERFLRAAVYVDRILRGARPGDLPVEQPSTFELTVNLVTARRLGLTIPPALLLRANHVIE